MQTWCINFQPYCWDQRHVIEGRGAMATPKKGLRILKETIPLSSSWIYIYIYHIYISYIYIFLFLEWIFKSSWRLTFIMFIEPDRTSISISKHGEWHVEWTNADSKNRERAIHQTCGQLKAIAAIGFLFPGLSTCNRFQLIELQRSLGRTRQRFFGRHVEYLECGWIRRNMKRN